MKETSLFLIGWSEGDITPDNQVLLYGQYYDRPSARIQSRLSATVCAMEKTRDGQSVEQSIMISIDLLWCTRDMLMAVRGIVEKELVDFDASKLLIFATHTHSGPEPSAVSDYGLSLVQKLAELAIDAWRKRKASGGVGHALAYAAIGHNRRVCYADGTTEMYGEVNRPDFVGIEGAEDSSMDLLFCWDENSELEGIMINIPCPAQVTEAKNYVSADYWHEVRIALQSRFKKELYILAQCGASGDLSPRDLTRDYRTNEPNMWEEEGTTVIAERVDLAVASAYRYALASRVSDPQFVHQVVRLDIPLRTITEEKYQEALRIVEEIYSREPKDPSDPNTAWNRFLAEIDANEKVKQFGPWDNKMSDFAILKKKELETQQYRNHPELKYYRADLHVLRIGEIAIATNPFELFVDYGFRIKGRAKPKQTFVVQLCNDYADYLPTERALMGEGYSAMGTMVGTDGGDVLAEKTVEMINKLF